MTDAGLTILIHDFLHLLLPPQRSLESLRTTDEGQWSHYKSLYRISARWGIKIMLSELVKQLH